MAKAKHVTRESWLLALVEETTPWFEEVGLTVPAFRISTGFTSKGARSTRIGECWYGTATDDGVPQVFVHPALNDPEAVAGVVVHEVIHAALGPGHGHGSTFKRPALALGLEGRMTATTPGEDLLKRLRPVLKRLGPYPHGALRPTGDPTSKSTSPKQGTRMLKVVCPECGYTARTTRKWLDIGAPLCPVDTIHLEEAA